MKLASISLLGFKSFGDRVQLDFAPGINAIVGPNGSGKSNVIDALRWVTGGGRAAAYRGQDKTDLIFHGAEGKRGLNFTEVEVRLEDGLKRLHIARSLFRDGQGRLSLGGKNARLLDVEEALAGSGLGRGGLSVIGQGEVGQVLMADPARLLAYIEEAAGVSKLSGRREQTVSRLELARDHLVRLDDLLQALQQQHTALSFEAEQAERAAELEARSLQLRYTLVLKRQQGLEAEVAKLDEARRGLENALHGGGEALQAAQRNLQRLKEQVVEREASFRTALTEAESRRGDARVAAERLRRLREGRVALRREEEAVGGEIESLAALAEPEPPDQELPQLEAVLSAAAAHQERCRARWQELEDAWRSEQTTLTRLRQRGAQEAQAQAAYLTREAQLRAERAELEARLASLEGTMALAEVRTLEAEVARQRATVKGLGVEREAQQARLGERQQAHAAALAQAQAAARTAARSRASYESRQGYAQGPRHALACGIAGVIGSVADLIEAPPDYALALSSALGRRAENIVVDSADTAQAVLGHLKRLGGRVTLLPLDLITSRGDQHYPALAAEPGFIGMVTSLIRYEPRFAAVVQQLLGGTALVETLEHGVAIARRHRRRPRLVSLGGDLIEAYGALTGGKAQAGGRLIGLLFEVEALEREAEERARLAEGSNGRAREAQEALQRKTEALKEAREGLDGLERAFAQTRERQAGQASLLKDLGARYEAVKAALGALRAPEETLTAAELEGVEARAKGLEEELERVRAGLSEASQRRSQAEGTLALYRERWGSFDDARQRYALAQARLEDLARRRREVEMSLSRLGEDALAAEEAWRQAEAAVPRDVEAKGQRYEEAKEASREAEARLGEISRVQAGSSAELAEVRLALARREASLEAAKEEVAVFPEGVSDLFGSPKSLRDELGRVGDELERIGPVNHRATLDRQAVAARLADLTGQAEEARAAADELQTLISSIDREVSSRLDRAISGVRQRFTRYAQGLFGGGEADIAVARQDARPSGLSISLRPPGKETRALNLLSVGERTMGALAFLFALMTSDDAQGLSTAILDEVDAPLDEANIRRFCGFLKGQRERTQFVLVTHQKATMEAADHLWGVTTERGVSRVFSIRKDPVSQQQG